jgi:hypothetical protein
MVIPILSKKETRFVSWLMCLFVLLVCFQLFGMHRVENQVLSIHLQSNCLILPSSLSQNDNDDLCREPAVTYTPDAAAFLVSIASAGAAARRSNMISRRVIDQMNINAP